MVSAVSAALIAHGSVAVASCEAEFERWFEALPDMLAAGKLELYAQAKEDPAKERGMASYSYIDETTFIKSYISTQRPVRREIANRFVLVDDWLACTEAAYTPDTDQTKEFFEGFERTFGDERRSLREIAEAAQ